MKEATVVEVKNYFGMDLKEFMIEWKAFTPEEKQALKIEVGKFLYGEDK